jgi:sodium/hydrogen antiporter
MLSLLVWLMFGVVAVVPALKDLTWQTVAYAMLSLTVIRMLPVAVALAGARLGRPAVLFSVLAHGLSADPLASRYGPRLTPPPETAGPAGLAEIPERRLIRRQPAQGTGKLLMTADQIPLRAGRRRRAGSPCGRVREQ